MTTTLPVKAKVMIGTVAVASLGALSVAAVKWQAQSWPQLMFLVAATVLSSRLKVKLPGLPTSMSGNLPVILLAVTQLGFFASLVVGLVAGIAQSFPSVTGGAKPKAIQFVFNACTLMNAAGLAYAGYHSKLVGRGAAASMMSLALAAAAFFFANTASVASIIGMIEGSSPWSLWHKVFLWSFPNYVIGAGLTAIVSAFSIIGGVATVMVATFGVYQSYLMYVARDARAGLETKAQSQSQDSPRTMAAAAGR